MTKTLLDKARSTPTKHRGQPISDEELDLMIAVINRDIGVTQAMGALQARYNTVVSQRCYIALRDAIRDGKIARIQRIHGKNGK